MRVLPYPEDPPVGDPPATPEPPPTTPVVEPPATPAPEPPKPPDTFDPVKMAHIIARQDPAVVMEMLAVAASKSDRLADAFDATGDPEPKPATPTGDPPPAASSIDEGARAEIHALKVQNWKNEAIMANGLNPSDASMLTGNNETEIRDSAVTLTARIATAVAASLEKAGQVPTPDPDGKIPATEPKQTPKTPDPPAPTYDGGAGLPTAEQASANLDRMAKTGEGMDSSFKRALGLPS